MNKEVWIRPNFFFVVGDVSRETSVIDHRAWAWAWAWAWVCGGDGGVGWRATR